MPAVDPARLRKQVSLVTEALTDPSRLRSRCLDVLEFYASRVRPGGGVVRGGQGRSLGVPTPVLRELERALLASARADTHAGAMAAETLWAAPIQEARLLAVALLEVQPADDLPGWVLAWSQTAGNSQLLQRLACGPLRLLRSVRSELSGRRWRHLRVGRPATGDDQSACRQGAVGDVDTADLPRLFGLLSRAPPQAGGVRRWRSSRAARRPRKRRALSGGRDRAEARAPLASLDRFWMTFPRVND
jgi:hypothetical protein